MTSKTNSLGSFNDAQPSTSDDFAHWGNNGEDTYYKLRELLGYDFPQTYDDHDRYLYDDKYDFLGSYGKIISIKYEVHPVTEYTLFICGQRCENAFRMQLHKFLTMIMEQYFLYGKRDIIENTTEFTIPGRPIPKIKLRQRIIFSPAFEDFIKNHKHSEISDAVIASCFEDIKTYFPIIQFKFNDPRIYRNVIMYVQNRAQIPQSRLLFTSSFNTEFKFEK